MHSSRTSSSTSAKKSRLDNTQFDIIVEFRASSPYNEEITAVIQIETDGSIIDLRTGIRYLDLEAWSQTTRYIQG